MTRSSSRVHAPVAGPPERLLLSAMGLDEQPALVKQLPVLGLFSVAVVLAMVVPTLVVSSTTALLGAVALMLAATALAAVLSKGDPADPRVLLVPAIDFLAAGVLRFATGESSSIFASLVILPTVWVAASPGRRHIVYAFLGVAVALLVPFLLGSSIAENPNELARGIFTVTAFGLAATVVNDLSRLARDHIADIRAREDRTIVELEQASAVQQALLPKSGTGAAGFEFAGMCLPSRAIGGDFYDWYAIEGGTAFTLGDVMGKGVGAGIIAATVRAVVRSARNHADLTVALERTSECLASDLGETASFATLFHGRLTEATGVVRYIDAGHGLSIHVRPDGSWERLASANLPVGVWSDEEWCTAQVQLEPGGVLVSCSDGILDIYDGTVESLRHVAEIVRSAVDADDIARRVHELALASVRDDDVTVLVLRRA